MANSGSTTLDSNDTLLSRLYRARADFIGKTRGLEPNILSIHPEQWDLLRTEVLHFNNPSEHGMRRVYGMEIYITHDAGDFRVSYGIEP
jgi:hypothetical protein